MGFEHVAAVWNFNKDNLRQLKLRSMPVWVRLGLAAALLYIAYRFFSAFLGYYRWLGDDLDFHDKTWQLMWNARQDPLDLLRLTWPFSTVLAFFITLGLFFKRGMNSRWLAFCLVVYCAYLFTSQFYDFYMIFFENATVGDSYFFKFWLWKGFIVSFAIFIPIFAMSKKLPAIGLFLLWSAILVCAFALMCWNPGPEIFWFTMAFLLSLILFPQLTLAAVQLVLVMFLAICGGAALGSYNSLTRK